MKVRYKKSASLTFRGFSVNPETIQSLVGVQAKLLGLQGSPMRPGRPNVWQRSVAKFEVEFTENFPISEMLPSLFEHIGGIEHLCSIREKTSPDFFEIDMVLPVKSSNEQVDGFITTETLADLYRLQSTLGFSFV